MHCVVFFPQSTKDMLLLFKYNKNKELNMKFTEKSMWNMHIINVNMNIFLNPLGLKIEPSYNVFICLTFVSHKQLMYQLTN